MKSCTHSFLFLLMAILLYGCSDSATEQQTSSIRENTASATVSVNPVAEASAPTASSAPPAPRYAPDAPASEDNQPPEIKAVAFANPYLHRGVDIELIPEAYDPEENEISFSYRWFLNGTEINEDFGPTFPGDRFSKGDKISVWVTPADEFNRGKIFYSAELEIPNAPPQLQSTEPLHFNGKTLHHVFSATDPDGDNFSFALQNAPEGMTIDSRSGELNWTRSDDQSGAWQFQIILQDETGPEATVDLNITVDDNSPPVQN